METESQETTVQHDRESETTATSVHDRANNGDVEAQWKINLARERKDKEECARLCTGLVKVPLRPADCRICPCVPRSMSLVDSDVVDVFRGLTTGKLPWPLYLWGPAGTGKTRACLALCDFVDRSRYFTIREACDAKMNADAANPWEGDWACQPVLIIADELGTRLKTSDLEYSVVTEIFESCERYGRGVAVYVSNLSPRDLGSVYDDRIASRVLSGTVFKLDGPDRRQLG